jgi:thiol-disulfide isomerase/thioredoxin
MSSRTAIAAGLVSGVAAATAVLVAAVLFLPEPSASNASPTPGSSESPTAIAGSATPAGGSASPATSPTASGADQLFHVGETAPPLKVAQVGGGEIDLANLAGQPVWVNFMQTTCPPCVDAFPVMSGFAARYADIGLVIVAIDVREDEGTVGAFAQGLNTTFPIGLDSDGAAQTAWGAVALPVHFWIDREGIIRAGALGGLGPDQMAENLGVILPGVEVTP